jgi:hypothetical protein
MTTTNITFLTKYEAAKHALAEARSVDEVKDVRDKSIALKLYARQAKDKKLEADAHEIRVRAERRLGEMIKEQKKTVGLNKGGKSAHRNRVSGKPGKPTLGSQGIDKNLADRSRKAAAMPAQEFEREIERDRERIASPVKAKIVNEKAEPKKVVVVGSLVDQCVDKVRATIEDALKQMRRGHAKQEKFEALFAALQDLVDDLQNKRDGGGIRREAEGALKLFEQKMTPKSAAQSPNQ